MHPVNVPVSLVVRVTVPVGLMAVPVDVSVTVTTQLVELLMSVVDGWQLIVIEAALRVETMFPLVPLLVECTLSP
jgi:hypothetical protein